ncbi:MAG: hypothetical protein D6732_26590 [Methanobacteriota archaeon]|nr:MAG: hypothetical protein D6732_26590 [Euryarchaeota archaeon]
MTTYGIRIIVTVEWFRELGIGESRIDFNEVGVRYSSSFYRLPHGYEDIPSIIISPDIPHGKRYGVFFNVGDSILLTLTGVLNEEVSTKDPEFREFARELEHDSISRILDYLEPMSDIYHFSYPRTRWVRYDKLHNFPNRFLVIGDALCSFNPIYGQGMTVASYEAYVLNELLKKNGLDNIHRKFYRKANSIVSLSWNLSSSDMLKYPEASGKRTLAIRFKNWYMKQVMLASGSEYINKKFLRVMTYLSSPATLFSPLFLVRLFLARPFRPKYEPDFDSIQRVRESHENVKPYQETSEIITQDH